MRPGAESKELKATTFWHVPCSMANGRIPGRGGSHMSPKDKEKKSENRVPLMMSDKELEAFDKARAKVYPLATRSAVIRALIEKFVKETK